MPTAEYMREYRRKNKEKIAEIETKKLHAVINGKKRILESSYKASIVGNYRGKGFAIYMYTMLMQHNTQNNGLWVSDKYMTDASLSIWQKLMHKYEFTVLVSDNRSIPTWYDIHDEAKMKEFGLINYAIRFIGNPELIFSEDFKNPRTRILIKNIPK